MASEIWVPLLTAVFGSIGTILSIRYRHNLQMKKELAKCTVQEAVEQDTELLGKLEELEPFLNELKNSELKELGIIELKKVYGIGEVYANQLYDKFNIIKYNHIYKLCRNSSSNKLYLICSIDFIKDI